jgi:hypothetical protein
MKPGVAPMNAGNIVNVSSDRPRSFRCAAYCVRLDQLTRCAALELAASGEVNA